MDKLKHILSFVKEKHFFYLMIFVNLIPIIQGPFFPTSDGPAHLYNTTLIEAFISGNEVISEYYKMNPELVPNWTGHLILMFFKSIFPAAFAEKLMLLVYFIGLPLSFRALIKTLNKDNILLSYFIFPFTYSFMMIMGFYNFSFAIMFMFIILRYWLVYQNNFGVKQMILMFVLLTATYFSHIFIFGITLFMIGILFFSSTIKEIYEKGDFKGQLKDILIKAGKLVAVSVFPLYLFLNYFISRGEVTDYSYLEFEELFFRLKNLTVLIHYDIGREGRYTIVFLYLTLLLFVIAIVYRIIGLIKKSKEAEKKIGIKDILFASDIWLFASIFMLYLFFTLPESGGGGGFITHRVMILIFLFLLVWIGIQKFNKKILILPVLAVLVWNFLLNEYYKDISLINNEAARNCASMSKHIEENAVVLPITRNTPWFMVHYSNYLGIEKPMIILENYEATMNYFPIQWNMETMPEPLLGDRSLKDFGGVPFFPYTSGKTRVIDYVFIMGDLYASQDPSEIDLRETIVKHYEVVEMNKTCVLFKLKAKP